VTLSNVELVRALYRNWERGDYSSSEWAHPEIEWAIADGPDPGTWRGVAAMAEGFRSSMGVWKEVRAEVEEYRQLDSERVLVLESRRARGKASGLELRNTCAQTEPCSSTCAMGRSRVSFSTGTANARSLTSGSRRRAAPDTRDRP
jgi:ketosteroid isomerase-like protein